MDPSIPFDVVIPYHPKDADILDYCVNGVRTFLKDARKIYIISQTDPEQDDTIWIPESRFPFQKSDVQAIVQCENGREGWYFQQLLKLYCSRLLGEELLPQVLLLDSDVVICRPISFFNSKGANLVNIYLDWNKDTHSPYFPHLQTVLGPEYTFNEEWYSGVTDHMMIRTDHLEDILRHIESKASVPGTPAWKLLLQAVDSQYKNMSGMSEFEMIYYYVLKNFPTEYERRPLRRHWSPYFKDLRNDSNDMVIFHSYFRYAT
jgi:hypothetical protein